MISPATELVGERFASLSADRTIRIWDTADATQLCQRKQQENDACAEAHK